MILSIGGRSFLSAYGRSAFIFEKLAEREK